MYLKPLDAEQLYDSLLIATESRKSEPDQLGARPERAGRLAAAVHHRLRDRRKRRGDDVQRNDPAGPADDERAFVQKAVSAEKGSFLYTVLSSETSDTTKVQRLYLATLSRHPQDTGVNRPPQNLIESESAINWPDTRTCFGRY